MRPDELIEALESCLIVRNCNNCPLKQYHNCLDKLFRESTKAVKLSHTLKTIVKYQNKEKKQ